MTNRSIQLQISKFLTASVPRRHGEVVKIITDADCFKVATSRHLLTISTSWTWTVPLNIFKPACSQFLQLYSTWLDLTDVCEFRCTSTSSKFPALGTLQFLHRQVRGRPQSCPVQPEPQLYSLVFCRIWRWWCRNLEWFGSQSFPVLIYLSQPCGICYWCMLVLKVLWMLWRWVCWKWLRCWTCWAQMDTERPYLLYHHHVVVFLLF